MDKSLKKIAKILDKKIDATPTPKRRFILELWTENYDVILQVGKIIHSLPSEWLVDTDYIVTKCSECWMDLDEDECECEVVCDVCDGKGYLTDVYDTEAEETQTQRCDSCKQFESDKQARENTESEVE